MNSRLIPSSPFLFLLLLIFLIIAEFPISSSNVEMYTSCGSLFKCGNITAGYPFWGQDRKSGCGHPDLGLVCEDNTTIIEMKDLRYRVLNVDDKLQILRIAREDYLNGLCVQQFKNTTLDTRLFDYDPSFGLITLHYGCTTFSVLIPYPFTCRVNGVPYDTGYILSPGTAPPESCNNSVNVPVPAELLRENDDLTGPVEEALKEGFEVIWKVNRTVCDACTESMGKCGYDINNQTICYCPYGLFGDKCSSLPPEASPEPPAAAPEPPAAAPKPDTSDNNTWKIYAGISGGVAGIILVAILLIRCLRRKLVLDKVMAFRKKKTQKDENKLEAFIRNYESLTPRRYSYSDVKTMTKSFIEKLGQGGFGAVYKGELSDGRLVAVKVLREAKDNGEEFINEVASISKTSHINVVTLLGFCYERTKRALIYEFMPNGSLDKFIYHKGNSDTNCQLEWKTLYEIAVGIARGLDYLHRGCNTRILHLDIKPHNILLDKNLRPKISDFGLAKLCKEEESIISMMGARGTAGYIAPEVFCRKFGGVSYKSDVYSYGMMVLEMVGGRKNIDVGVSHTSEIYFPHWIYKHLEPGEDLRLQGVMTEEEDETARKMITVGLWCIQTKPSDRPSMTKVVEMLEGSLESLQIPPKPFLSSPVRTPQQSSTASSLPSIMHSQGLFENE